MSDKELLQIVDTVVKDKENGVRAEALIPYAKEIFAILNVDVNHPTIPPA